MRDAIAGCILVAQGKIHGEYRKRLPWVIRREHQKPSWFLGEHDRHKNKGSIRFIWLVANRFIINLLTIDPYHSVDLVPDLQPNAHYQGATEFG